MKCEDLRCAWHLTGPEGMWLRTTGMASVSNLSRSDFSGYVSSTEFYNIGNMVHSPDPGLVDLMPSLLGRHKMYGACVCIVYVKIPWQWEIEKNNQASETTQVIFANYRTYADRIFVTCVILVYIHIWVLACVMEFMHCDEILLVWCMGEDLQPGQVAMKMILYKPWMNSWLSQRSKGFSLAAVHKLLGLQAKKKMLTGSCVLSFLSL